MIQLLFSLLSLGQLGRISLYNQQVNFYFYEVFASGWFVWLFIKYRLKPLYIGFTQFKYIYFFLVFLLASYLFNIAGYSSFQNIVAMLYLVRLSFYFLFFIYLIYHLKNKSIRNSGLNKGMLLFILLTTVFFLVQYFLYPDLRNLFYLGWDPHLYRVFGLFLDTSTTAAIIGTIILYLLIDFKKIKLNKNLKIIILALFSILGLLTYSRGFYIAISITLIYFLFKQKLFKLIAVFILLFVVGLYLLPKPFGEGVNLKRTFSINSRITNYQEGLKIWQKNPIFGVGYNRIRYAKEQLAILEQNPYGNHTLATLNSSFLIILSTGGIIGLVLFFLLLFDLSKLNPLSKYLTIFLSIYSLWDNILLQSFVLMLYLLLLI